MLEVTNTTESKLQDSLLMEKEDKALTLELLKCRFTAQQNLCTDYGKACMVWLIALGFMIKYAFEPGVADETRRVLCISGIVFSVIGVIANVFVNRVMQGIDSDIVTLIQRLNFPVSHLKTEKLQFVLVISALFDVIIIVVLFMGLMK